MDNRLTSLGRSLSQDLNVDNNTKGSIFLAKRSLGRRQGQVSNENGRWLVLGHAVVLDQQLRLGRDRTALFRGLRKRVHNVVTESLIRVGESEEDFWKIWERAAYHQSIAATVVEVELDKEAVVQSVNNAGCLGGQPDIVDLSILADDAANLGFGQGVRGSLLDNDVGAFASRSAIIHVQQRKKLTASGGHLSAARAAKNLHLGTSDDSGFGVCILL